MTPQIFPNPRPTPDLLWNNKKGHLDTGAPEASFVNSNGAVGGSAVLAADDAGVVVSCDGF